MHKVKLPSWPRFRYLFSRDSVNKSIFLIFLVGNFVRLENVLPVDWTYLFGKNYLLSFLTFDYITLSNVGIVYIASLAYLAGYILFKLNLPRDIEVSTSGGDYIDRSLNRINEHNILSWYDKYDSQLNKGGIEISNELRNDFHQYRQFLKENKNVGKSIPMDEYIKSNIVNLLIARYNYYSYNHGMLARFFVALLVGVSFSLSLLVTIETVVISLNSFI